MQLDFSIKKKKTKDHDKAKEGKLDWRDFISQQELTTAIQLSLVPRGKGLPTVSKGQKDAESDSEPSCDNFEEEDLI